MSDFKNILISKELNIRSIKWHKKIRGQFWTQFRQKTMNYKWVKMPKMDIFKFFKVNNSSHEVFYWLSDGFTIFEIGATKLKLWLNDVHLYVHLL